MSKIVAQQQGREKAWAVGRRGRWAGVVYLEKEVLIATHEYIC